jgi:hypothetical protein
MQNCAFSKPTQPIASVLKILQQDQEQKRQARAVHWQWQNNDSEGSTQSMMQAL